MFKPKLLSLLTLSTAAAGFALALFTAHGCTSNCGANCPAAAVVIGSNDNYDFNTILTGLDVRGPACPASYGVGCTGDQYSTACTHVTITAIAPGACDLLLQFSDRPDEIVHMQFGQPDNANGACCHGFPVLGPSVYTIPDKPTGPIYSGGGDAGPIDTDNVTVVTDGGTDAAQDAGADAGL